MQFKLQPKQYKSFINGGSIQLSKLQLLDDYEPSKNYKNTLINLNDVGMKKYNQSSRLNKGFRVGNNMHNGGSLLGDIKKTFSSKNIKKTGNTIESGFKQAGKEIVKTANDVDKWAKKVDLGGYVEQIKSQVPQSTMTIILTSAMVAGASATGNPALIAMAPVLASSASAAFYKADFSKNLNGQGEAVGIAAAKAGAQEGVKQYKSSKSKSESKGGEGFHQGSEAMRLKMQRLRSMKKGGNGIRDSVKTLKALTFGQSDFTANVKKILKQYENQEIYNMNIVRTPVNGLVLGAMDAVSLGNFSKNMDKANFDELYHLQIDITLANGQVIAVEKTEVVNIRKGKTIHKHKEEETVDNIPNITFGELMENCQASMGSKFFSYSAKLNNCQDFALALLKSSDIGNDSDYTFIKQNTKQLFKNQGLLNKVSDKLTGIGAKANILMNGGSFKSSGGSFKGGSFKGGSFRSSGDGFNQKPFIYRG